MGIEVYWDDPAKTIIWGKFTGRWSWEEFNSAIENVADQMNTVDHRVDIIADMQEGGAVPIGSSITTARNAMRQYPDNWGIIVIVASNRFVQILINTFSSVTEFGDRTYAVNDIESARKLIAEQIEADNQSSSKD